MNINLNNKKTLLLDIDGVQRNLVTKILEIYKRDFNPDSKLKFDDVKDFDLNVVFPDLGGKIVDIFFHNYAREVFVESKPYIENISSVVSELREMYFVHMVTHQFPGNEVYALEWLENYGVPFDAISFIQDKSKIYGDILVDDGPHNLTSLFYNGVPVACIERPWNENWRKDFPKLPSYKSLSDFLEYEKNRS